MYIAVRGSDHYAPPTREVRGNYSNDGINHVSPQEAFIIIEILAPPSSPSSFPFLRSLSIFPSALSPGLLSSLCKLFYAA